MTKTNSRSLSWHKERAWKAFSEYVRRKYSNRDGYSRCYTCEINAHWKDLQCGHGIAGRNNAVLFDEDICRPQCVHCNIFRHGQLHIFATKLSIEIGQDVWLKKLADSNKQVKRNRFDYEGLAEIYKQRIEELKGE